MDLKAFSSPGNTRTAMNMSCDTESDWPGCSRVMLSWGGCITTTSVLLFSHPRTPTIL